MENLTFTAGKVSRNELELPRLHFIVVDDWEEKLGADVIFMWLRFYSFCNRMDKGREYDKVPQSLNKLAKRLGITRKTLYNKYLKPLWNYGLIDLETYDDPNYLGHKPINIIVYRYPCNDKRRETLPIEKVRDYDTDYTSEARTFALLAGNTGSTSDVQTADISTGVVSEKKQGVVSKKKQGVVSSGIHNNPLKELNNPLKELNNPCKYVSSAALSLFNSNLKNSTYTTRELKSLVEQYSDELVMEAVQRAITNEAGMPIKYVKGVLSKWQQAGCTTVESIQSYEERFRARRKKTEVQQKPDAANRKATRKEQLPEWFDDRNQSQGSQTEAVELEEERRKLEEELKQYQRA